MTFAERSRWSVEIPVSTIPTVTDVLPVVMFHAAGALILASPHSWGDRGSFGAASAW